MKNRQNSDRTIFQKKINIFNKIKNTKDNNFSTLCPIVINNFNSINIKKVQSNNAKNSKFKRLQKNIIFNSKDENKWKIKNKFYIYKNKTFYKLNRLLSTQEKQIQTINITQTNNRNEEEKEKENHLKNKLLFKKVNKFLFDKKLKKVKSNSYFDRQSIVNSYNNTFNNSSFNKTSLNKFTNAKKSIKEKKFDLTNKKFSTLINDNYNSNLIKFKNQVFKYNLFKRKRKMDKLLYNIKKSEVMEIRKMNNDLSIKKAKCLNQKHKIIFKNGT